MLNGVRQTGKSKISDFHVGDQRGCASALAIADADLLAERFQVVEHNNRTFVKAEVFYRVFDFPVFNIESTIAREACVQECLRINSAYVPETRDQHTLLGVLDHVFE